MGASDSAAMRRDAFIPVMRPLLPTAEELFPYLRRIDAARYYSNHGPLLLEFEARLAAHFGVTTNQLTSVANGTVALSAALTAAGARPGSKCLLPSWTFVASAGAVCAANLRPHFVDVSADTWMIDPRDLLERRDLADVGAVMVVSAFGAPVDILAWDAFTEATGIPVVVDGAAAFDTVASIAEARVARTPVMISLHATKVLGVGEGAIVMSSEPQTVARVRQICSFGSLGDPAEQILGYNGKLSEYHAAVGLAALDGWDKRRQELGQLSARYIDGLAGIAGVSMLPGYGNGWVSSYCNLKYDGVLQTLIRHLNELQIQTRRWWNGGVHTQPAYATFERDALPVTEELAAHVVALPFFHDLAKHQVERVLEAVCG